MYVFNANFRDIVKCYHLQLHQESLIYSGTHCSVMLQYSLVDRRPEEAVLKMLLADNVGVIVRGPVAKGWLAGRVREGDYLDYSHGELVDVVEKLRPWASEQRSLSQLALRYALSHPAVTTVIPGASTVEQLRENASAANVASLGEDELAALRRITRANRYEVHR